MKYLLDTMVISELVKSSPEQKVADWISKRNEQDFYLSVLTFGELWKGIEKLPKSRKQLDLKEWVDTSLRQRFHNRILPVDLEVTQSWGKLQAKAESHGKPMPAIDGLIAATAYYHHLTVVTRNIDHMAAGEVELVNPWE